MDKSVMEKFYEENKVDFRNDDELWNINQDLHVQFLNLSRKMDKEKKNIIDKIYNMVFDYIDISSKKNFYNAFSIGLYFKNNFDKGEE